MEKAIGLTLLLIFGGWALNYEFGSRDYTTKQQAINNITYRYTQIAGKKGELNPTIYNELESKLNIYGNFDIKVVAERFNSDDTITKIEGTDVIGLDLRENEFDILTIFVEDTKKHFLNTVLEVSPLGRVDANYKLNGKSSVYIQ